MMEPTPVYICTGFLDSGKTLLVKDTLMEQEWSDRTYMILCEEGEKNIPRNIWKKMMVLLKIDKFEQLNAAFLQTARRTIIRRRLSLNTMECGSWKICYSKYPRKWQIQEFILLLMERHWICT